MPRKCAYEGCSKGASYNCEGEKQGLYCKTHMEPDMIDVVCQYSGCNRPSYNMKGMKPMYCATHRKDDMIDVVNLYRVYENPLL